MLIWNVTALLAKSVELQYWGNSNIAGLKVNILLPSIFLWEESSVTDSKTKQKQNNWKSTFLQPLILIYFHVICFKRLISHHPNSKISIKWIFIFSILRVKFLPFGINLKIIFKEEFLEQLLIVWRWGEGKE